SSVVGGGIVSWLWDFGDGNISTEQHPSHSFSKEGEFTVQLTVTSAKGCSRTTSRKVNVLPTPQADFSFSDACVSKEISFRNTSSPASGITYLWDFGDGTTSTLSDPVHAYENAQTYHVVLTATSPNGCIT